MNLLGKKLLVLGGKPIGSIELVTRAKELGLYVIVTDYLPVEQSPAKTIADEVWDISTAEVDILVTKCREQKVDGILTGVHEFNINRMLDICAKLNKPCYCSPSTWIYCDDKIKFKRLCQENGIPVARKYDVDLQDSKLLQSVPFPVVVKPVDGSGSRGFKVCHNLDELKNGYENALNYSPGKKVLIEDYMPYDSVIIHYTMDKGRCYFSGIADKYSAKFSSTGAPVMGIQIFPARGKSEYLEKLNAKVCDMFENAGFEDGPIWIEAFYNGKGNFVFNEMGYRFGGSLTYYPVQYFYGIDQLDLLIHSAFNIVDSDLPLYEENSVPKHKYCILPVHVKAGIVTKILGIEEICHRKDVYAYVPVHFEGDEIKDWGSAQQVFCYLHLLFDTPDDLLSSIKEILNVLKALDSNGVNLLYTLYDISRIKAIC